jgi:hypothetical protein
LKPAASPAVLNGRACGGFRSVKGRFTGAQPIPSAIQTALISGLAAAAGFGLSKIILK